MKKYINLIKQDKNRNSTRTSLVYLYFYRRACARGHFVSKAIYECLSILLHCALPKSIGGGLRLPHPYGIIISNYSVIGDNCTIFHNVTLGANEHRPDYRNGPILGNNVYIGTGAILIGPIIVGDGAVIGAGAIVTKDVPSNAMVIDTNQICKRNPVYRV